MHEAENRHWQAYGYYKGQHEPENLNRHWPGYYQGQHEAENPNRDRQPQRERDNRETAAENRQRRAPSVPRERESRRDRPGP